MDTIGDWLEFPASLSLTDRSRPYIRSSYKSIAEQALTQEDVKRRKYVPVLVTGTWGTRKSVFLSYVLWRLIKDKKRVLLLTTKPAVYFDGKSIWNVDQLPKPGNLQFWSPDLWCLVGSAAPTCIDARCSIVLKTSPRQDYAGEFMKSNPTPDVCYMSLWSMEELSTISCLYEVAQDVWENRFEYLGGVPRLVEKTKENPQTLLENACALCSFDECTMSVSLHSRTDRVKVVQPLIHLHSEHPFMSNTNWPRI